ncbi:MAG: Uma2 family endonuclease [Solirubrobacteraceae bacterium]
MSALVQQPELHQLSIEEYHRIVACGGFDEDARVELIDGLILDMSPKTPQHENAVRWLIDWLVGHLDHSQRQHMVSGPLTIGSSEPEPDLAVIERAEPRLEHPKHALLVIEVAVSSGDRDLRVKPAVYARAVDEYWVVDLERRCVVVHRDPAGGAYRDVSTVPAGDQLRARSVDLGGLPTGELFATAFAESQPDLPQR